MIRVHFRMWIVLKGNELSQRELNLGPHGKILLRTINIIISYRGLLSSLFCLGGVGKMVKAGAKSPVFFAPWDNFLSKFKCALYLLESFEYLSNWLTLLEVNVLKESINP